MSWGDHVKEHCSDDITVSDSRVYCDDNMGEAGGGDKSCAAKGRWES